MDQPNIYKREMKIPAEDAVLNGNMFIPDDAQALVLFAHGSGSSRFSSRNRYVAGYLNDSGLGTLLFDLLTENEERIDQITAALRFDIDLLAERLAIVTGWIKNQEEAGDLEIGYFGASTGAAAALIAAAKLGEEIYAIVSRGGRPDLADNALPKVTAPTLLIVGGNDRQVIELNEIALDGLRKASEKRLAIVPGATHLFEEPGALEMVAELARDWFIEHLQGNLLERAA
jgi:pimeloyl-ACP methyl ester carboxylesterase